MSTFRVPVTPSVLEWAMNRSGKDQNELFARAKGLQSWLDGTSQPTYAQLERFAEQTYTPFGDFFLPEPPVEEIPIPDYRTMGNQKRLVPSPDLLETIYLCEQRQDWYQQHAVASGAEPLEFVGSVSINDDERQVARRIRAQLQFTLADRKQDASWSAALRRLIDTAEEAGILVMISGIVGNNTHRLLDPNEFRGFALSDMFAPLVFINGADTKAAQIFTLVHEVCHLWLGQSALSDASMGSDSSNETELWCNRVAAEVLVPSGALVENFRGPVGTEELERLARLFKERTLVMLKSLFDATLLKWSEFKPQYDAELDRVLDLVAARGKGTGGDYYNVQPLRVSRKFAKAIISDTYTGRTLHRDAYRLLGTKKHGTFTELGKRLGAA